VTVVDELTESLIGSRPTLSHVTARLEVQHMVGSVLMSIPAPAEIAPAVVEQADAA
jgi:hypothetical protein